MRRYKKMPMSLIIDSSTNQTMSRTIMTSITTSLAILALVIFGGEVIRSFTIAMLFGVIVGTYSSIYIAAPILILFKLRSDDGADAKDVEDQGASRQAQNEPGRRSGYTSRQALIDVYGNGGFRFADMSHRGSILCCRPAFMPGRRWRAHLCSCGTSTR